MTKHEDHAPWMSDYPEELGPVARQEWDRICPEIKASDLSKPIDRSVLTMYCACYALWVEAAEAIQKFGAVIKAPSGYPMPSPYVAIFNQQVATMTRIAAEFGFTPAARGRLPFPTQIVYDEPTPTPKLQLLPRRRKRR